MRFRRLRGAAVAVAGVVALSGCGPAHPGAAAQVGDVSISDERLQQSTLGFCGLIDAINAAQQRPGTPVSVRSALLTALNSLVMGVALDQLAEQNDVTVTASEIREWEAQLPLDLDNAPESRVEDLEAVTERVARNALLVEKLGRVVHERENPGSENPSVEQIQALGQRLASNYLQKVGTETNPRYGQVLDVQMLPGTGSLSVAVSDTAIEGRTVPDPNALTQTQECP